MPEDRLKTSNKSQDKVTAAQVAAVNKLLKESVKTTDDLAKNLKIINNALNDGTIQQKEFNELLDEQVEKYVSAKKLAYELNQYSKDYNDRQKETLASWDRQIAQEKVRQHDARVALSFEMEREEQRLAFAREQNTLYELRAKSEQLTLEKLNAQKTIQFNILHDENTGDKQRLTAINKYIELVKEQEKLEGASAKNKEKQTWEAFNLNRAKEAERRGDLKEAEQIKKNLSAPVKDYRYNEQTGQIEFVDVFDKIVGKASDKLSDKFGAENEKMTKTLSGVLQSGFNSLNSMIDTATNLYSSAYGRVNAAIDGVGKTFDDYVDGMQNLGLSTLVKQADLLKNLSDVASQGIATDLEQIALLSTIKDKTVASFQATDGNLRRLVRLNQNMGNLTAKQFGLAAVLRTELNQAFGDSSFIGRQFQSLTGALLDAVSANALKGGTDSTNFYAVMETFAAGMYEAGVDEGTVSAIAQGINYLGSGNVQALSGNKALQNLMLLSLDNAGLDYATILQQGLSTKDTYLLLQSIVDYLADITDTTKKNNVLQSSYANLFNLSITDMSAIRNLSQNSTFQNMALSSVYQTGSWALDQATNEMLAVSEERTTFAEALNNFIDNSKFSLGIGVASSKWAYPLYKLAGLALDASTLLSNAGLEKTAVVKGLKYAGLGAYGASLLPGVFNLVTDLGGNLSAIGSEKNTISNYFSANLSNTEGMYSGTATGTALSQATMSNNFKGFNNPYGTEYENKMKSSEVYSESSQWQAEAEAAEQDPNTKILKEFEKTLMKANEGDGYAFAVSLQGMSDGVLRSFASIFADEEAMMETLTGKNNALEENNTFINYVNDSSTKPTSSTSSGSTVVK